MSDDNPSDAEPAASGNSVDVDDNVLREEGPAVARRRRRTGFAVQVLVVGGLIVAALGYTAWSSFHNSASERSRLARGPHVNGTPAGPEQARSQHYQDSLDTANNAGASRAEQNGSSFVATPDQPLHNVDQMPDQGPPHVVQYPVAPANKPKRQPIVAHTAPAQQPARSRPKSEPKPDYDGINKLAARMGAQEASLMKQWAPTGSANTVVLKENLYKTPEQRRAEAEKKRAAALAALPASQRNLLAKAGHFVFARTLNGSDSDTPGPVVAEIFQHGPLYHARVLGKFTKNQNTQELIVQFNDLVLPNGDEIPISAYAVDGAKGSIAVRSGIDRRYLQRYGPLLAGAFISGLGETLSEPSQSVVIGNNTTTVVQDKQRLKDALYAGAGQVGEKMASDIAQSAPKGPLVKLDAGYTIGILFMKSVEAPKDSDTQLAGQ